MIQNPPQRTDHFFPAAVAALCLALAASPAMAAPLGTSFTYQGVLKDDLGDPQTGSFDFIFELHDDAMADSQVGPTVIKNSVTVTDGLFIVELDFGAVFDGADLWLEIEVDTTVLSPRQHLTAAPYALFAAVAGSTSVPAPVPESGQRTCWDAGGTVISCTGTGHDGEFRRGVEWPIPRFTDNGDGTVTDNLTGLIWLKDASCADLAGTDVDGGGNWTTALSAAAALSSGTCGLTDGSSAGDWRLPQVQELHSLIDYEFSLPALSDAAGTAQWTEGDAFSGVQSEIYWSSTSLALFPWDAWDLVLTLGFVDSNAKSSTRFVWPVRGGQ